MKIRTKLESIEKIDEMNLNRFPEQLFKNGQEDKVEEFLSTYPVDYYAIRSKEICRM